jgi:hypothetical protein
MPRTGAASHSQKHIQVSTALCPHFLCLSHAPACLQACAPCLRLDTPCLTSALLLLAPALWGAQVWCLEPSDVHFPNLVHVSKEVRRLPQQPGVTGLGSAARSWGDMLACKRACLRARRSWQIADCSTQWTSQYPGRSCSHCMELPERPQRLTGAQSIA